MSIAASRLRFVLLAVARLGLAVGFLCTLTSSDGVAQGPEAAPAVRPDLMLIGVKVHRLDMFGRVLRPRDLAHG